MIRDPFYRQIVQALGGRLDPELFERCAADLLRDDIPTLVPIRGGGDFGMDGAIADLKGPAYPLVCTTSDDVIGNLTLSLQSYLEHDGTRRKVVSATSRHLTPTRRRNLERRAVELGFELVHIYDQAAIADRLYRNPAWCRELLNLTGMPPALTAVPSTKRPLAGDVPVGRDADLEWLRVADGDCLLVGQPGSGKTFLLCALARDGWGLFLVDDDRGRIADALRAQQPGIVIVDDAHVRREIIQQLRHLRDETGAAFHIVATSWPGSHERVAETLNLPSTRTRQLEPLTRDEIVAVVRGAGVAGPDPLIRSIVDQAEGRPGLAVTLADMCLRGAVREVALGDALSRNVRESFEPVVGEEGIQLIAAFALGGDAGMPVDRVAQTLGLARLEVAQKIASLAYGGIVTEVGPPGDDQVVIVVRPSALRHALVRDVFFNRPGRLPHQPLIEHAPNLSDVARTLVGARASGASIPLEVMHSVLEHANSPMAWDEYAWLGSEEAAWVVEHHPELALDVADSALRRAPQVILPVLLTCAMGDDRPLHRHPDHPRRQIEDWIGDAEPGTGEAVRRREVLLRSTVGWLRAGGNPEVGLHALSLALAPNFRRYSTDPGSGRTLYWSSGLLSHGDLAAIHELWPTARNIIAAIDQPDWQHVVRTIEGWAYPKNWFDGELPAETAELLRSAAAEMLADVAALAKGRPGVLYRIRGAAERVGTVIDTSGNEVFEALYGKYDWSDEVSWHQARARVAEDVRALAVRWSCDDPAEVAARVVTLESEVAAAGRSGPRRTPDLADELASRSKSANAWLSAFLGSPVSADIVEPFLRRAALVQEPGWENLVLGAMERPELRAAVIWVVLSAPDPPTALLDAGIAALPEFAYVAREACERGLAPEPTVLRLLRHDDASVAGSAALGEWFSAPEGDVRESLTAYWRRAIRRYPDGEYELAQALRHDPGLAHDWLRTQIRAGRHLWFVWAKDPVAAALDALDKAGRRCILELLHQSRIDGEFVARLIGDDVELYTHLLDDSRLRAFHLAPLAGRPADGWTGKAKVALARGFAHERIAESIFSTSMSWTGNESAMWASWIDDLACMAQDTDESIRAIAQRAREIAAAARDRALICERHDAVFGR